MPVQPTIGVATLLVMAGGGVGAAMRFHTGRLMTRLLGPGFPYGTLVCNILGGALMGVLVGLLARHDGGNEGWRLALGVGMLGGFTTFSSFSLECWNMIERGQMVQAATYALISVVVSVLAVLIGLMLVRTFA